MKKIEERINLVHQLIKAVSANRDRLIETAVKDAGFTIRECRIEVDMNLDNLKGFDEMIPVFSETTAHLPAGSGGCPVAAV